MKWNVVRADTIMIKCWFRSYKYDEIYLTPDLLLRMLMVVALLKNQSVFGIL